MVSVDVKHHVYLLTCVKKLVNWKDCSVICLALLLLVVQEGVVFKQFIFISQYYTAGVC